MTGISSENAFNFTQFKKLLLPQLFFQNIKDPCMDAQALS
jgi:hypothetical protein